MTTADEHKNAKANSITIYVDVSNEPKAGTKSPISIQIFGERYTTGRIMLQDNSFEPKKESGFRFDLRVDPLDDAADNSEMSYDTGVPLAVKLENHGDDAIKVDNVRLMYRFKDNDPNDAHYKFPFENTVLGEPGDFGEADVSRVGVSYLGQGTRLSNGDAVSRTMKYQSKGYLWTNDSDSEHTQSFSIQETISATVFDNAIRTDSQTNTLTLSASAEASFGGFGGSASAENTDEETVEESRGSGTEVEKEMTKAAEQTFTIGPRKTVFAVCDLYMDLTGKKYDLPDLTLEFVKPVGLDVSMEASSIYEGDSVADIENRIQNTAHKAMLRELSGP
ncbi:hypothetical protein [Parasedimentitalea huanghaiensis]|uniref:Uncharacterized protein n=1 Tax=Parasedimentitalea huanghaiensis TaxID=2682100 RepID=A0A6L6WL84_9RHOB|nr:hypothetical protein [Zongyanglinia huanghaiensis]MVO18616.1 hypothetical protein [Zongyanglinia huanghaiensis]